MVPQPIHGPIHPLEWNRKFHSHIKAHLITTDTDGRVSISQFHHLSSLQCQAGYSTYLTFVALLRHESATSPLGTLNSKKARINVPRGLFQLPLNTHKHLLSPRHGDTVGNARAWHQHGGKCHSTPSLFFKYSLSLSLFKINYVLFSSWGWLRVTHWFPITSFPTLHGWSSTSIISFPILYGWSSTSF